MYIGTEQVLSHMRFSSLDTATDFAALTYLGKKIFAQLIAWWRKKPFKLNADFTITLTNQRQSVNSQRQSIKRRNNNGCRAVTKK